MGCDIHCFGEKQESSVLGLVWVDTLSCAFDLRVYSIFAFLAGVRNYSGIKPISDPRGLPLDGISAKAKRELESEDIHSRSWLSMQELTAFDYTQPMEDRRCMREISPGLMSGGATCNPGEGIKTTYREYLGEYFFQELKKLKNSGAERIVFGFDN